jgi:hydrogenase maturation protease
MATGAHSGQSTLVIGCGNADRGDDAAGLLVARRLRALGVEAREQSGDAAALLETWRTVPAGQRVIVVDAMVTGSPPGYTSCWDARTAQLSSGSLRCSTHALGVAEAVGLAKALGILPPELLIYGIEGARFDAGAEPSPEVLQAAEQLAGLIAGEV